MRIRRLLAPLLTRDRDGFAMPVVLFAMVIMSIMAVAAIDSSMDQQRSSAAVRRSGEAFYAAETGLNVVHAEWADTSSNLDSLAAALASGGSLDLGWDTLPSGAVYHAELMRIDEGGQALFLLTVEASDRSGMAGEREVSLLLTATAGGDGAGFMLGECCDAAVILKGDYGARGRNGGFVRHSGFDQHPPDWADAGVCSDTMYDKPGMVMADSSGNLSLDDPADAVLEGDPWLVVDPSITDDKFDNFGPYTWDEVRDRATIIIDAGTGCASMADGSNPVCGLGSAGQIKLEGDEVYPRYSGDMICDTGHPLNWGSDDPSNACFNHFPIILTRKEVEVRNNDGNRFYGQGVIIMDYDSVAGTGAEFEFETDANFRGVVLGKGCVEVQKGAQFYGSIFLDAEYDGMSCDKSNNFYVDCYGDQGCVETRIQWSQCAVDRALTQSDLFDMVTPTVTNSGGVMTRIRTRSFSELLR